MAELSNRVWCILVDHNFGRILGDVFPVDMSSESAVADLRKKIRVKRPSVLQFLDHHTLTVWRCPGLKLPAIGENGNEVMVRINISREAQIYPGSIQVSRLSMPPDEMPLVQMPGTYSLSIQVFK